jgi:hypothetical protein
VKEGIAPLVMPKNKLREGMEAKVVISEKEGELVLLFWGVPVYLNCSCGARKFEEPDLRLTVEGLFMVDLGTVLQQQKYNMFLPPLLNGQLPPD